MTSLNLQVNINYLVIMKNEKCFVYVINSRVLWMDSRAFHIPILNDLYSVYLIENPPEIPPDECVNYTVKSLRSFVQDSLVQAFLTDIERDATLLNREKIRIYLRLCDYINTSYLTSLPPVFFDEKDKIDVLASSLIDGDAVALEPDSRHFAFIESLIIEKKIALKKIFLHHSSQIKSASSLSDLKKISAELNYNEITVT